MADFTRLASLGQVAFALLLALLLVAAYSYDVWLAVGLMLLWVTGYTVYNVRRRKLATARHEAERPWRAGSGDE